jgi:hypothetical protein
MDYGWSLPMIHKSVMHGQWVSNVNRPTICPIFNNFSDAGNEILPLNLYEDSRALGTERSVRRCLSRFSGNSGSFIRPEQKITLPERRASENDSDNDEPFRIFRQRLRRSIFSAFVSGAFVVAIFFLLVWAWNSPSDEQRNRDRKNGGK